MSGPPPGSLTVQVRYFAALADLAGRDEEPLTLSDASPATVASVLAVVLARHPALAPQRPYFRIARNTDFVKDDDGVAPGDVIALLPPFAGG